VTTQPDWQQASDRADEADEDTSMDDAAPVSASYDADASPATETDTDTDPDLVVVAARDDDLDEGDELDEGDLDDEDDADDSIVVGEVLSETVVAEPMTAEADLPETDGYVPGQPESAAASLNGNGYSNGTTAEAGPQWRDIQAQFVDDPQGSVQLAAAAVDEAVSELVESLHQRRASLTPADGPADGPDNTEQLREALRSCRTFCENLAELSQQLAQPRV
jgi:hypothetical protein